jgi:hypothetical protein
MPSVAVDGLVFTPVFYVVVPRAFGAKKLHAESSAQTHAAAV